MNHPACVQALQDEDHLGCIKPHLSFVQFNVLDQGQQISSWTVLRGTKQLLVGLKRECKVHEEASVVSDYFKYPLFRGHVLHCDCASVDHF